MTALERLYNAAVVPVVVLDDAATAKALLAGGVDVMEITFRTAAAADSIAAVAKECPDMLVGAGTVITLEQCKKAVACGAKFIVAPGYSEEVVSWCVENDIAITPGCVTPTEIMAAMSHGLKVVKFFPANVYGGLSAMKALSGPFGGIKFIPTGGVNDKNLAEYISAPFIHAVGGSWLCAKADIAAHNFDKITSLCKEARKTALGFEIAHVGVNAGDAEESLAVCRALDAAFGFAGLPIGGQLNLAATKEIQVLDMTQEEIDKVLAGNAAYIQTKIPAGTYTGQDNDANTFGVKCLIIVTADMDADLVYDLCKAMNEHTEEMAAGNALLKDMTDPSFLCTQMPIPLHDGAQKYYSEQGLI